MKTTPPRFHSRHHAGHLLAQALRQYAHRQDLLVLGLPRGGVPVAFEVAQALRAPLDLIVVRKLGVPGWEEVAMGAISCGGHRILNRDVIRRAGVTPDQIKAATARELRELHRREIAYRNRTGAPDIKGKTVLLVDDGIATGSTLHAAIQVLRAQQPTALVVAAPIASEAAVESILPEVDDLIALPIPETFGSVSQWYEDFDQTTDAEVKRLLALSSQPAPPQDSASSRQLAPAPP